MEGGVTTAAANKVVARVPAAELATALGRIAHIRGRGPIDVLSHVLVELGPHGLRMSVTDLNCWARLTVPCESDGEIAICLPTDTLAGIVRSLPKGDVRLEVSDHKVKLVAGGTYTIHGVDAANFPVFPNVEGQTWTVSAERLKRVLTFLGWCRSDEVSRPILHGVWLDTPNGRAAGTSGHALGIVPLCDPIENGPTPIIYETAISGLLKMLGTSDVVMCADENRLRVDHDGIEFVTALIVGPFPNIDQVVPREHTFTAKVSRAELLAAAERALIYVGSQPSPRMRLEWRKDTLTVSSLNPDKGEQNETLWTEANGELRISFSVRYVINTLKNLQGDQVTIQGTKSERAAIWHGAADPNEFYLVMPLRDLD
jgi:DNA polymerase-3 subunit beta